MKTQREAVFTTTVNVLTDLGINFKSGANVSEVMTDEARKAIQEILVQEFEDGAISLDQTDANKEKLTNAAKLSAYVSGLVSNWFRKDKRLNGGVNYVSKNPGSRAGSSDPEIKALRILSKNYDAGSPEFHTIQSAIAEKLSTMKASKALKVDTSAISPELLAKIGL